MRHAMQTHLLMVNIRARIRIMSGGSLFIQFTVRIHSIVRSFFFNGLLFINCAAIVCNIYLRGSTIPTYSLFYDLKLNVRAFDSSTDLNRSRSLNTFDLLTLC